ncbi:MAG: RimK family alpha-L-glutamate ligase [Candidatus Nanohaloarchaeota archaeon QJJ-5]|nr:RimK family alpha-L-glutamate ligase [Candidatus Nanohaloarchaeota archaeon QJJ-5]
MMIKCAVIYGKKSAQHHHFIEKGKEYFDTVLGVPLESVRIVYGEEDTRLMYRNTNLNEFDAVFIRFLGSDLLYGEHIPEILEEHDVYTQLETDSLTIASNKFYSVKTLGEGGIPVPDSTYTLSTKETERAAKELGYPVIIKLISGYGGKGVMRAEDESGLSPIIDTLTLFEQDVSLQRYIENPGEDIRVIVLGDETFSYKRVGGEDEWRSNISAGGERQQHDATEEMREVSRKAARLCGFDFCGIDILEGEDGFYIGEINMSPGVESTDEAVGIDMADRVMEFIYRKTHAFQSERGI